MLIPEKYHMKQNIKNRKGFTLIELLLVIFIISLLASIVLVSITKSRQKARDLATFYSLRSTAGPAFACLNSNLEGVELTSMDESINSICKYGTTAVNGFPDWPDISKNGWSNRLLTDTNSNGFFWCGVGYTGTNHPNNVGFYDGEHGGSAGGTFCYMLINDGRYMWCTEHGCRKEGF